MTPYPNLRKARRRNDAQRERSRAGVAARAAKRLALGQVATIELGRVEFFGRIYGRHTVVLTCREDHPDAVDITVDGQPRWTKTQRGTRAMLINKLTAKAHPA